MGPMNGLVVDSDQRRRMVQDRGRMVHDGRMRHSRHDGLDHRHGVHDRCVVHDRSVMDDGVGDDQLGGGMVDDVPGQ